MPGTIRIQATAANPLVVSFTRQDGTVASCFSDYGLTTPVTLPVTVSSDTSFYFSGPDTYTISCKVNGSEIASANGTTVTQFLPQGQVFVFAPSVDLVERTPLENGTYASVANGLVPTAPGYGFSPTSLKKWRAAVGAVRAGTGFAKLACVGDSTTMGFGAAGTNPARDASYPAQLLALLNAYHCPASRGVVIPVNSALTDSRWAAGSGWTANPGSLGWANNNVYQATTGTTGNLTFTPGTNVDTFDIYFLRNGGLGTSLVSVDGGATSSMATAGTAGTGKFTVTVTAGSGHVLTIPPPTGGSLFITGVDAYLSTAKSIRVSNLGVGSSRSDTWNQTGLGSINAIKAVAPDLTIFMLGINDSAVAMTPAAHTTNMQALIAAAQVSGDVIVMSVVPSNPADATHPIATEVLYQAADLALVTTGIAAVDVLARLGSYAANVAAGFDQGDGVHLNEKGYADIASAVFTALRAVA